MQFSGKMAKEKKNFWGWRVPPHVWEIMDLPLIEKFHNMIWLSNTWHVLTCIYVLAANSSLRPL